MQQYTLRLLKTLDRVCVENDIYYTLASGTALGAIRHKGPIPWDYDVDVHVLACQMDLLREKLLASLEPDMKLYMWDRDPSAHQPCDHFGYTFAPCDELHVDLFPICGLPTGEGEATRYVKSCYVKTKIFHCKRKSLRFVNRRNVVPTAALKVLLAVVPQSVVLDQYGKMLSAYDLDTSESVYIMPWAPRFIFPKKMMLDIIRVPYEDAEFNIVRDWDGYLTKLYGDYMTPVRY